MTRAKKKTRQEKIEELIEAGYWEFDAMRHGYGAWKGTAHTERDAFKLAVRRIYAQILRII